MPSDGPTPEAPISRSVTRLLGGLAAVLLLVGAGSPSGRDAVAATAADAAPRTSYGAPALRCTVGAPGLGTVGGIVAARDRLYLVTTAGSVTISTVDGSCRPTRITALTAPGLPSPGLERAPPSGIADVAMAADGALWLADVAGSRSTVALYQWNGGRGAQRYVLRYPDGAHRAEALLLSYAGEVVVVTSAGDGRSAVYAARLPLRPDSALSKVADLAVPEIRAPGDTARGSLLVTGGAVAPDGTHFALRTGTAGYEWDTPDGDVVRALRTGTPRVVAMPAGAGITYAGDARRFLTIGASVPAAVHEVAIVRSPAASSAAPTSLPVLGGLAAALMLGVGVVVLGRQRRRTAAKVTTYQSVG